MRKGCLMNELESALPDLSSPVIGVPGYWHESEAILGRMATAVPDSYIRALLKINAIPLIIPVIPSSKILARFFKMIDGLLLVGGPDLDPIHYHQSAHTGLRKVTPDRDNVELKVLSWALDADIPILAICRGIQVLNVVTGGTLWQDIALQLPDAAKHDYHPNYPEDFLAHTVTPLPGSRLSAIVGDDEQSVNSLHHQAIDKLGQGLRPVAYAPDGIVEAVEGIDARWIVGVQWHPEWLVESDPRMLALFKAFGDACTSYDRTSVQTTLRSGT
jgi:putative glutamine amidotransferase